MDLDVHTLLAGFLVSSIGFVVFWYGRKLRRPPQLVIGLALMGYPYFVGGVMTVLAIGAGLLAALWIAVRLGY